MTEVDLVGALKGSVLAAKERRLRGSLISQLAVVASIGQSIGGVGIDMTRTTEIFDRRGPAGMERILAIYSRWIYTSPRKICPECSGRGLVGYAGVGADCPCLTCGGGYGRGRGWVER